MGGQHHGAPKKDIFPTPTSEMAVEGKNWEEPHTGQHRGHKGEGVSWRRERLSLRKKLSHCRGGGLDFLN